MDDGNSVTTRLLTLLNVSAVKASKRKRTCDGFSLPTEKLNRRPVLIPASVVDTPNLDSGDTMQVPEKEPADNENDSEGALSPVLSATSAHFISEGVLDPYEEHFGNNPEVLSASSKKAVEENSWNISKDKRGILGRTVTAIPGGAEPTRPKTVKASVRAT
jgi:U3 small nucleolar RNA-associated protein 25